MNKKERKYFLPIILFLIIQNYISSEMFFLLGCAYLVFYVGFKENFKLYMPFKEYRILIIFLIWGLLLGVINRLLLQNENYMDFVRDIFYFSNPLVYIYIGFLYAKENINIYKIFNSLIIAGTIMSLLAIMNMLDGLTQLSNIITVQGWRNITGDGVMVGAIGLAIIFSKVIPKEQRLSNKFNILSIITMTSVLLISLSRTNLLIFVITYLILSIKNSNNKIPIKKILMIVGVIILFFVMIYIIFPKNVSELIIGKMLNSINEIDANHDWDSFAEVQGNWRGYETHSALKEWRESNIFNKMFGHGFGKRIYVGNYAYDLLKQTDSYGNKADSIPVLHNGYATMLVKLGILGTGLYLLFYLLLISKSRKELKRDSNDVNTKVLLTVGLVLLIQTYFLNGLYKDYCFYPLIILLGYSGFKVQLNVIKKEKII